MIANMKKKAKPKKKVVLVSNCCGVPNRMIGPDGPDWKDVSRCPKCKEGCVFEPEEDT
jgi:hypothetical protein